MQSLRRVQTWDAGLPEGCHGAQRKEYEKLKRVPVWEAGLPNWKYGLNREQWWAESDPHRTLLKAVNSHYALGDLRSQPLEDMKHLAIGA